MPESKNNKAKSSSKDALNGLHNLQNSFSMIQNQFQNETVSEMAAKLEKIMRDYLFISKEQERLKESTSSLSRNSSQLKIMAYNKQLVQEVLEEVRTSKENWVNPIKKLFEPVLK